MAKSDRVSSFLDHLYSLDYEERPVDIDTFLCNNEFLGNLTDNGRIIYPVWREALREITTEDSKYLVILTGALRIGKTRAAIYASLYTMYRLLCLKDPWKFFRKGSGGKLSIVFYNLTKSLGSSQGFNLLMGHACKSPWFLDHGVLCGSDEHPRIEFNIFEYLLSSPQAKGYGFIGKDIIIAMMDEVDDPNATEGSKQKVLNLYNAGMRRFEDTFVFDGQSVGRFFLLASKQEKLSFLNTFITEMKGSKQVYLKDFAIWEAKSTGEYCGERFMVSLGDVYIPAKIVNDQTEKEEEIRNGREVIEVPVEFKEKFELDIIGSLRDFAGISTSQIRAAKLFASESVLYNCYDKEKVNPVKRETIEIGLKDDVDLIKFIDLSAIRIPRNVPRYIHIDIAFSGDALGIGMSCIKGWMKTNVMREDGTFIAKKAPVAETDLAIRIKARPGDQIPIHKIRKLVLDLKDVYKFNIALCSFDLRLASTDGMQILERAGVKCEYFSMDKDPQVYRGFRDIVGEGRWICFYDSYLHFELANLEDDRKRNRIDHPSRVQDIILDNGTTTEIVRPGSKDKSDGVAGSVMKAIEKCNEPPDIEVMKKLFGTLKEEEKKDMDVSSLIGIKTEPPKPNDDEKLNSESSIYREILKKAMG